MKYSESHWPEPMQRLIPPEDFATKYVRRKVHGLPDFDLLDYALKEKMNVLMAGPTGSGKTSLGKAYAAARRMPFFALTPGGAAEPSQIFGKDKLVSKDGATHMEWVDGILTSFVRHGGVVVFDEVNFIPPAITAIAHPLLDGQRVIALLDHIETYEDPQDHSKHGMAEIVPASPDLLVLSAYNPGYIGTEELNEAFKNRFTINLEWGYHEEVEQELCCSPILMGIARELRKMHDEGDIQTPVSTNRLQAFEMIVEDLGLDVAISNFISSFTASEQEPVTNAFTMNRDNLINDYTNVLGRDPLKGFFAEN